MIPRDWRTDNNACDNPDHPSPSDLADDNPGHGPKLDASERLELVERLVALQGGADDAARSCSVPRCPKPRKGRKDMCGMHIERVRKYGTTDKPPAPTPPTVCVIEGCSATPSTRRHCEFHATEIRDRRDRDRYESHVSRSQGGCWGWSGPVSTSGYSLVSRRYGHRLAYEWFVGPIPPGMQIDHLCRNRICTNPEHLEAVTSAENTRRGNSPSAISARTNLCFRGHELTPENSYVLSNGRWRQCRTCLRASWRAAYSRTRCDNRYCRTTVDLADDPAALCDTCGRVTCDGCGSCDCQDGAA